jgi:tetratricopeptide (TPR) repeat protein
LAASADTIVLKNGRRIVAQNVVDEGGRVTCETAGGEVSLPKSIVARIERDGAVTAAEPAASGAAIAPPRIDPSEGFADVARATIHDGSIDLGYLARLEEATNGGDAAALAKLAAAQHVAAQFLLSHGEIEGAMDHYRRALIFAPDNVGLLLNLAVLHLRRSEYTAALDPLEHARRVAPESQEAAKLTGWAHYGADHLDQAVEEWKRAERLRPDPEVESALEKAERDRREERNFREGETAHFTLKYHGGAAPALAHAILRTLEEHFQRLASDLDYISPEPIAVILYTNQEFADITRAPSWAGAINDGRIRVPVQGLETMTPELSRVLKHELTHSFVQQKTRGHCPVWLQEGIAQWMEGRRSGDAAAALLAASGQKALPPLASLEGPWLSMPNDLAALAYAWSLATVEMIIETDGMTDLERLLDQLPSVPTTEAALRATLRSDYADLEEQTLSYLRHSYMH